jgi:hypothetical protein
MKRTVIIIAAHVLAMSGPITPAHARWFRDDYVWLHNEHVGTDKDLRASMRGCRNHTDKDSFHRCMNRHGWTAR